MKAFGEKSIRVFVVVRIVVGIATVGVQGVDLVKMVGGAVLPSLASLVKTIQHTPV